MKEITQNPQARPTISFEFFPPKTEAGEAKFWEVATELARYTPDFISVTYGAGGSSREGTARLVCTAKDRLGLTAMAHLTCIGDSRENLDNLLRHYQDHGTRHILALRGDRNDQMPEDILEQGDFTSSVDFINHIRKNYPGLQVGVACYPEVHPNAQSREADLDFYLQKVDAGAHFAITQFFFDNSAYHRFVEDTRRLGSNIPVIPGILPITDFKQVKRFAQLCGSSLPEDIVSRLERVQDDTRAMFEIGMEVAIKQCRDLLDNGVPGLHFFALNRSEAVSHILDELQILQKQ